MVEHSGFVFCVEAPLIECCFSFGSFYNECEENYPFSYDKNWGGH